MCRNRVYGTPRCCGCSGSGLYHPERITDPGSYMLGQQTGPQSCQCARPPIDSCGRHTSLQYAVGSRLCHRAPKSCPPRTSQPQRSAGCSSAQLASSSSSADHKPQLRIGFACRQSHQCNRCARQAPRMHNFFEELANLHLPSTRHGGSQSTQSRTGPCSPSSAHQINAASSGRTRHQNMTFRSSLVCTAANTGSPHREPLQHGGGRRRRDRPPHISMEMERTECRSTLPPGKQLLTPQHLEMAVARLESGGSSGWCGTGSNHGLRICDRPCREAPAPFLSSFAQANCQAAASVCAWMTQRSCRQH
mmetsp:Transcript_73353/g.174747  ORF Transcript_73353/g.174747 Transcript_73353/m.174747 type:complete len:306 (-) Transcript_73353:546-1463(-)